MIRRAGTILFPVFVLALALSGCRREPAAQKTTPTRPATTAQQPSGQQPAAEEESPGVSVGQKMPDYSTHDLEGKKLSISDFRGKAVLVNVWATWCGPCRYEIPDLIALQKKYGSRGFEILGVSIDDEGDVQAIRDFVKAQKMNYAIAHDPKADVLTLLNTSVIPTSVLVDRSGKVVWMHHSVLSADDRVFTSALEIALAR